MKSYGEEVIESQRLLNAAVAAESLGRPADMSLPAERAEQEAGKPRDLQQDLAIAAQQSSRKRKADSSEQQEVRH